MNIRTPLVKLTIFFLLNTNSMASNFSRNQMTSDFEGNGLTAVFEKFPESNGIGVTYRSSSMRKLYSYNIKYMDECGSVDFYPIVGSPFVAVDGSCIGQGSQVHVYLFIWEKYYSNWCMRREIVGERADISDGRIFPSETVRRVVGCTIMGDASLISYEDPKIVQAEISDQLKTVKKFKNDKESMKKFSSSLRDFDISEITNHIDHNNVKNANDLAFYMINSSDYYGAGQILSAIVEKFPARVVAKLNLADAYWNIDGARNQAKETYLKYLEQVKNLNEESRIPARVMERIK
jgi:hypothetical protein